LPGQKQEAAVKFVLTLGARRRLQSVISADVLTAFATAIASSLGVPARNVVVTQESPTTLGVVVRASGDSASADPSAAAAPMVDVASITSAVTSPSFVQSVASRVTAAGVSGIVIQAVSAPTQVSVVVEAPTPPPPSPIPSPPSPTAPAIQLSSTSKGGQGVPTGRGATPPNDGNMILALVVGTVFAILMMLCFPFGGALLMWWARKKRRAVIKAREAAFISIVPQMVDAETQCSDAGDDDDFMTGLGDLGAGALGGALGMRSRVDSSPGRVDASPCAQLAESTPSAEPRHDRIPAPTTPGRGPRSDVTLSL
jgi:hypothetical protein